MNNQAMLDWLKEAETDIMNFIENATSEEIAMEINDYTAWTKHIVNVVNKDTWAIQFENVFVDPMIEIENTLIEFKRESSKGIKKQQQVVNVYDFNKYDYIA